MALAVALGTVLGVHQVFAGVLGAVAPSVILHERAAASRLVARHGLTRIVAATHVALSSGTPLPDALRRALEASEDPLAREPVSRALRSFALGASLDDALRASARSESDDRMRLVLDSLAFSIGERLALERAALVVGSLAERLAYEERLDEEVRARAGGARAQVKILAALVPGLAMYLAFTTPGVGSVLASPVGHGLLIPAGALLEMAGILLSGRAVAAASR